MKKPIFLIMTHVNVGLYDKHLVRSGMSYYNLQRANRFHYSVLSTLTLGSHDIHEIMYVLLGSEL